jgi:hypothetical protein
LGVLEKPVLIRIFSEFAAGRYGGREDGTA